MNFVTIANQAIQTADGSFCRLLSGFTAESSGLTPICRVERTVGVNQYGVIHLTPTDFKVAHTFSLTTDPTVFMMSDREYTRSEIFAHHPSDKSLKNLLLTAIYSRMAYYQTALAHASLVEAEGGGVMFIGPSGVGKTTQAILWEKYLGAEIINGDKVFLTYENGYVIGHGSPWNGSSPYIVNKSVPLRGIVVLTQAAENHIRQLSAVETLGAYVPHIFLPQWDKVLTDMVLQTVCAMLPLVPVYALSCRPDEEAARVTYNAVFS